MSVNSPEMKGRKPWCTENLANGLIFLQFKVAAVYPVKHEQHHRHLPKSDAVIRSLDSNIYHVDRDTNITVCL